MAFSAHSRSEKNLLELEGDWVMRGNGSILRGGPA